ncbi:DUF551 domain-containing protein [Burkholderia pseudomallei]|nr:DUF551 domain-containing protein [Burkholderia pseudomallei]
MKITDDMLTEFESWWEGFAYSWVSDHDLALAAWQAARRTTPDREKWISVEERVPDTADFVLAANRMGSVNRIQYYQGTWIGMGFVTHWMPLPTAPTSDKRGA